MIWKTLIGIALALVVIISIARRTPSTVYVERTFNAPVDKVWHVWTDAEAMKNWWSPKDFTAPVIKSDFQVGGTFLYSMQSPKGEMFWNAGRYTEIIPNQKIVSMLSFSDETGRILKGDEIKVPGVWPDEISMTVEFEDLNGSTKVKVTEAGIPALMKLMSKMGWEQQFDKFEGLLK